MIALEVAANAAGLSTHAVAQATHIPVTTILAWERRYGLPRPRRGASGERVYSPADVALLHAMRARTADGVRARVAARELLAGPGELVPTPSMRLVLLPTEVQEVHCLTCGDVSGELLTQRGAEGVRVQFALAPHAVAPRPGSDGRPRCGRCGGDLYREPLERRALPPLVSTTSARGAA